MSIAPAYFRIELADTTASLNFTISIVDTTIDCAANLPTNQPIISPNPNVTINFSKTDVETATSCGRKITRSWSATFTDANGRQQNLSTVQTITQTDKIAPTITLVKTLHATSLPLNFLTQGVFIVSALSDHQFSM